MDFSNTVDATSAGMNDLPPVQTASSQPSWADQVLGTTDSPAVAHLPPPTTQLPVSVYSPKPPAPVPKQVMAQQPNFTTGRGQPVAPAPAVAQANFAQSKVGTNYPGMFAPTAAPKAAAKQQAPPSRQETPDLSAQSFAEDEEVRQPTLRSQSILGRSSTTPVVLVFPHLEIILQGGVIASVRYRRIAQLHCRLPNQWQQSNPVAFALKERASVFSVSVDRSLVISETGVMILAARTPNVELQQVEVSFGETDDNSWDSAISRAYACVGIPSLARSDVRPQAPAQAAPRINSARGGNRGGRGGRGGQSTRGRRPEA